MKKIFFLLIIFSITFNCFSQDDSDQEMRTLFGQAKSHGGYGAPFYRYGIINNQGAYINGGRGAWIINHNIALGGCGTSFTSEIMYDSEKNINYQINGGYGGVLIEPILLYKFPLHIAIPIVVGAGGYSYTVKDYYNEDYIEDTKPYFLVEPGVEFELNVLKFFRMNFGAYYRYAYETRLRYSNGEIINAVSPNALDNLSFGITFKFGKF